MGRDLFESRGVAMLGTLRRDGSPRVSAIEPFIAAGELIFGVMESAKSRDLARDARCTVHSAVADPTGSAGEFKVFGRAVLIDDQATRDAADGWWKSFPPSAAAVYRMEIESAAHLAWDWTRSRYTATTWSARAGSHVEEGTYPPA